MREKDIVYAQGLPFVLAFYKALGKGLAQEQGRIKCNILRSIKY